MRLISRTTTAPRLAGCALAAVLALGGCSPQGSTPAEGETVDVVTEAEPDDDASYEAEAEPEGIPLEPTLREVAPPGFYIGTIASGGGHLGDFEPWRQNPILNELIRTQFNSITPENQSKMEPLRPTRDSYYFGELDQIVDFAEENGMRVRGHTLMWHRQNPTWLDSGVASGELGADELREILHDHISTVVGRYAGRIAEWDVANEIFTDDGTWREENPFIAALGPEIVADAFRWAHEADPEAKLFLNDYSVEWNNAKSQAYWDFIPVLLEQGVPVHGMGVQGHLTTFPNNFQQNIQRFADLGVDVEITELDIRMPAVDDDGFLTSGDALWQGELYRRSMNACLGVADCTGVTVWGIGDYYSWVSNEFPGTGAATPFDMLLQPKPAFAAIREALQAASAR